MLHCYYDLSCSPPTYDVVAFLCAIERERIVRGENQIRIEILPGPSGGFRNDSFWPHSVVERQAMLENVVLPMCRMLPSVAEVAVLRDRPRRAALRSIGYGTPFYGLKVQIAAMRAGVRPLRPQGRSVVASKLVTITLREAEHWPQRNSNVPAWAEVAGRLSWLQSLGRMWERFNLDVRVIRDTRFADEPIPGVRTYPAASRDLMLRAQLYRASWCNLFVNNGPAWLALALDAPVLMLKPTVEGVLRPFSADYFRDCGIEPGGQIPGSPAYQRIAWADDASADAIVDVFEEYTGAQRAAA